MNLLINEEIKSILKSKGIPLHQGVPFLLSVYFNYLPDYFPEDLRKRIFTTNIFTVDLSSKKSSSSLDVVWNTPLFQGQAVDPFDWIDEYMNLFGKLNKKRKGNRSYVMGRMKETFMKHPDIRKEEVLEAAKKYLSTVDDPTYVISADKFISNIKGTPLLDFIMELRSSKNEEGTNQNPFKKII